MNCEHCDLVAASRIEAADGSYVNLCDECAALVVRPNTAWQRKDREQVQKVVDEMVRSSKKHWMFGNWHN